MTNGGGVLRTILNLWRKLSSLSLRGGRQPDVAISQCAVAESPGPMRKRNRPVRLHTTLLHSSFLFLHPAKRRAGALLPRTGVIRRRGIFFDGP